MATQQTYAVAPTTNRADFNREDFEAVIQQKGRDVTLEKAIQCPCKSPSTNQQSDCKNCGGVGWLFVNPKLTKLVLQGINITPDYKAWSEEIKGDMKVTASDTEELSYMDRLTLMNSRAIYNEVIFFRSKGAVRYAYTVYDIKEIKYIAYFQGTDLPLRQLVQGQDFTFEKNIIKLVNPALIDIQGHVSITIRYVHAPTYYMLDMTRESMETFVMEGGKEKLIHLPISGTARRGNYMLKPFTLNGSILLNNDIPA